MSKVTKTMFLRYLFHPTSTWMDYKSKQWILKRLRIPREYDALKRQWMGLKKRVENKYKPNFNK